jgi:hypothetical protein
MKIDLNEARIPANSEVLSGRDCGEEFRRRFKLEDEDRREEPVHVLIPDEIISMNTSFFLGLFAPSVRRLGPTKFFEKYNFECDDIHMSTIREGVIRAMKEHTIFSQRTA